MVLALEIVLSLRINRYVPPSSSSSPKGEEKARRREERGVRAGHAVSRGIPSAENHHYHQQQQPQGRRESTAARGTRGRKGEADLCASAVVPDPGLAFDLQNVRISLVIEVARTREERESVESRRNTRKREREYIGNAHFFDG